MIDPPPRIKPGAEHAGGFARFLFPQEAARLCHGQAQRGVPLRLNVL
jgi:hypothetical protein